MYKKWISILCALLLAAGSLAGVYVAGADTETKTVTGAMYFTFVLRSLGYTEGADGDFTWDEPFAAAADAGIADETLSVDAFTRGDVVKISWYALHATKKDSDVTLAKELTDAGAITEKAMARADTVLVDVPFQKVTWNGKTRRFAAVQTMDDDGSETLPSVDESEPIDVPTDPTITDR